MPDIGDIAQKEWAFHEQIALNAREQFVGKSLSECEECGESIPRQRQAEIPGVRLCVDCKTIEEERERREGRR